MATLAFECLFVVIGLSVPAVVVNKLVLEEKLINAFDLMPLAVWTLKLF